MTIAFQIDGTDFVALNDGQVAPDGTDLRAQFTLSSSSAVSFVINCTTQNDVDDLWKNLLDGGQPMQRVWIKDKFGVTWQIVPEGLTDLFGGDDPEKSARVMKAMMGMEELDINALRAAYRG